MTGESATPSHPCSHIRQDPFTSDSDQSLIPHLPRWPHYNVRTCLGLEWPYHPQLWWSRSSVLTKTWSLLENKILETCNNLTVQFPIFHQSSFCNIIIRCWESSSNMSRWRMFFNIFSRIQSKGWPKLSALAGWFCFSVLRGILTHQNQSAGELTQNMNIADTHLSTHKYCITNTTTLSSLVWSQCGWGRVVGVMDLGRHSLVDTNNVDCLRM